MKFFNSILLLLTLAHRSVFTIAAPLEERQQDVCSSCIYPEAVPLLQSYLYAQEYCSAAFNLTCATTATAPSLLAMPEVLQTTSTPRQTQTIPPISAQSSAWLSFQPHPPCAISTLCSCIQACPSTTSSTTSFSTESTPSPARPTCKGTSAGHAILGQHIYDDDLDAYCTYNLLSCYLYPEGIDACYATCDDDIRCAQGIYNASSAECVLAYVSDCCPEYDCGPSEDEPSVAAGIAGRKL